MKVIFFGTTDFAVASLDQLIKDGVDIVGVVTTPDESKNIPTQKSQEPNFSKKNK